MKKILDHKIGDYLYEQVAKDEEPYTAGKIVAMSESSVRKDMVYVLLQSDDEEYTIYSCVSSCYCRPFLARFIPRDSLVELLREFGALPIDATQKKVKEKKEDPAASLENNETHEIADIPPIAPVAPPPVQKSKVAPKPKPPAPAAADGDIRDNIFDTIFGAP
jgi:hypothetical protein